MRVTLKDIAKLANVSVATVSKVVNNKTDDLSEETIKHVQGILKEYNYIPNKLARSMKTKVTKTIGLIVPDIRNAFFIDMVRGVEDFAFSLGYSILISSSDGDFEKEMKLVRMFDEQQVDGLLIVAANERDIKIEKAFKTNLPTIAVDRDLNYPFVLAKVCMNNKLSGLLAVEHLLMSGHRNILFLAGPKDSEVSLARLSGFREGYSNYGLDFNEEAVKYGRFVIEAGTQLIFETSNLDQYSAILCSNDLMAYGALLALNELNYKVPDDISLIGIDNIVYSKLTNPALTTINQDAYLLGKTAINSLIDHLNGRTIDKMISLDSHIIVRESVKSIN